MRSVISGTNNSPGSSGWIHVNKLNNRSSSSLTTSWSTKLFVSRIRLGMCVVMGSTIGPTKGWKNHIVYRICNFQIELTSGRFNQGSSWKSIKRAFEKSNSTGNYISWRVVVTLTRKCVHVILNWSLSQISINKSNSCSGGVPAGRNTRISYKSKSTNSM